MGAAIVGTGAYLPARVVTNDDLVRMGVDTSDDWIVSRIGIRTRHWAGSDEATSDLAANAARLALERAGASISDVRLLICATSTPDYQLPATASLVQHKLGGSGGAFDVNGVCSGFVHALIAGFACCEKFGDGLVVVVGADIYSRLLDLRDRGTAPFFGDGAGAVVLAPRDCASWLLSEVSASDGEHYDKVIVPMGGSRRPSTTQGLAEGELCVRMQGRAVWEFVASKMPAAVRSVVARAGLKLDEIDMLVPHQANRRMLEHCLDALGIDGGRALLNVDRYGNTAAASIPIALDEAHTSGRIGAGHRLVLVGFGSGLSWSAACLRWGERGEQP